MKVSCCALTRVAGSSLPTVKSDCLWWSRLFFRCLCLCKSANKHGMKTSCKETGFSRTNSNFFLFSRVWNLQSLTNRSFRDKRRAKHHFPHCSFFFFWRPTIRLSKFAARKKTVFKGAYFLEKSFRIKDSWDIKEHFLDILIFSGGNIISHSGNL